jgi:hypothetical protein
MALGTEPVNGPETSFANAIEAQSNRPGNFDDRELRVRWLVRA